MDNIALIMTTLVLVRHGQSLYNASNRYTGQANIALNETGREQARDLGRIFNAMGLAFDEVYSSDLSRAFETVQTALENSNVKRPPEGIIRLKSLRERDYGDLTHMDKDECVELYGVDYMHRVRRDVAMRAPNGESILDIKARFENFLKGHVIGQREDRTILIGGHHRLFQAALLALGAEDEQSLPKRKIPNAKPLLFKL